MWNGPAPRTRGFSFLAADRRAAVGGRGGEGNLRALPSGRPPDLGRALLAAAVCDQGLSAHPPRHRRLGRRHQQQRRRSCRCATASPVSGITINGLPILLKRPTPGSMDIEDLDVYYEDCVIGGPGAFVIPIRERDQFKGATRSKLVLEIAGRTPEPRVIPAAASAPRISCTIGERMWRERWGE